MDPGLNDFNAEVPHADCDDVPRPIDLTAIARERKVAALDERIGTLAAQIHSLEAELVATLAEHDRLGGWHNGDFRTHSTWISLRTKFTPGDSRRFAAVAAKADLVAALLDDARQGQLSVGMISHAARIATPANIDALANMLHACTPAQAFRVLNTYRDLKPPSPAEPVDPVPPSEGTDDGSPTAEPPAEPPAEPAPDLWWRNWIDDQGRHRIDAALDALTGAALEQARRAIQAQADKAHRDSDSNSNTNGDGDSDNVDASPPGDTPRSETPIGDTSAEPVGPEAPPPRPMTADEITAALAQSVIENAHRAGTLDRHGERFDIQIIADLDTIAGALGIELDHNRPVRIGSKAYLPATRQHLTDLQLAEAICSGSLQVLIEHDGNPLWLGRTKRLFTRAQRRALAHRAGGHVCEIPGCGRSRYIEAHHIERYEVGGRTDLDNGILVCTEHHEKIHRHKWRIVCNGANHTIYDGDRCLGTTGPPSQHPAQPSGPPPDLSQLPFVEHLPTPITKITGDTPRSTGGGEPLTRYALDTFLNHLLAG